MESGTYFVYPQFEFNVLHIPNYNDYFCKKIKSMNTKIIFLSILISFQLLLNAEIKVASALGDNMVMQRNTEVKIWGKANPKEKITVTASWNKSIATTMSNQNGEWLVKVKTTEAGGPYSITISTVKEKVTLKNILLGEVWLCSGQSNMEMTMAGFGDSPINGSNEMLADAENNNLRLFTVKRLSTTTPQDTCAGKWEAANAETVSRFSATAYMYGKQLQQKLKVPVGLISSSWGGSRIEAWINKESMANFPDALAQTTLEKTPVNHKASQLYNGMISPILNYTIKGAIWYQGESNITNYKDYAALMAGMVSNWRKDFAVGNFPFYYVEIAPYWYNNSKAISSALQRNEQLKAMSLIQNSGMASTMDIGEEKNIHPAEKEIVGKRLAFWALSETYGMKGISYKSPTFKAMVVKDSVALISFDNVVNGLSTFGKEVESFEIAGQDSVFYPAKMNITQKQARVWSTKVKAPVAVRYGFCNFPVTNGFLYNTTGLPVSSFRTDNWQK